MLEDSEPGTSSDEYETSPWPSKLELEMTYLSITVLND